MGGSVYLENQKNEFSSFYHADEARVIAYGELTILMPNSAASMAGERRRRPAGRIAANENGSALIRSEVKCILKAIIESEAAKSAPS